MGKGFEFEIKSRSSKYFLLFRAGNTAVNNSARLWIDYLVFPSFQEDPSIYSLGHDDHRELWDFCFNFTVKFSNRFLRHKSILKL